MSDNDIELTANIEADLRPGNGTDVLIGQVEFGSPVQLPSETSRESDPDGIIVLEHLEIIEAGAGVCVASHPDENTLITTEPTTGDLINWIEENAEPAPM